MKRLHRHPPFGGTFCAMVSICLLGAALPSAVQAGGSMFDPLVDSIVAKVDTNQDGQISRREFDEAREARFQAADGNRDRQLDFEEFHRAWIAEIGELGRIWAHQAFSATDMDADRILSEPEVGEVGDSVFGYLDEDGDGRVSRQEIKFSGALSVARD